MEFRDEIRNPPPPPPPPPPSAPYEVETVPVGIDRTQVVKVCPNGLKDNLTDDEAAVWARVEFFRDALASGAAPVGEPPAMPYDVKPFTYGASGIGVERLTKVYPLGGGPILAPDEVKVWEYLQDLERQVAALPAPGGSPAVPEAETVDPVPTATSAPPAEAKPSQWRKWA